MVPWGPALGGFPWCAWASAAVGVHPPLADQRALAGGEVGPGRRVLNRTASCAEVMVTGRCPYSAADRHA
jgi:hypothetical protein